MRKLGWYALSVAVGVFVLGSLALLAANLYVQSHRVQQRIRAALEAALGAPVSLRKTTVTPWDGIRLDGFALHGQETDGEGDPADLLTAASFRVRLAWWPLLNRHQIVIKQALLDRPRLTLREDLDEQLVQEAAPSAESLGGSPPGAQSPTVATEPTPPAAVSPSVAPAQEPPRSTSTTFPLPLAKKLRLRHGEFSLLDRDDHSRLHIEEINADGRIVDPQRARGALWFAKATGEMPGATITDYWTAVDYDSDAGLALRDGHGNVAGGLLTTDFRLQPQAGRLCFATTEKLANVALGQLTRASAEQPPLADGLLHGTLDLRGFTDDPASIVGGGRLWMDGARLHNFPLIKIIGQVLRIADLSQLEFKQAQMDYRMEDAILHVDGLTLVSNDGQIVIRGRYLITEDQLDFHGRLTIDHAISHQLPQFIESNFTRCGAEAPGCRYLDFDVTGTRDDPRCNLYDRLTAGPMKGLLDNLLAPRPKNSRAVHSETAKKRRPALNDTPPKP